MALEQAFLSNPPSSGDPGGRAREAEMVCVSFLAVGPYLGKYVLPSFQPQAVDLIFLDYVPVSRW